MTAHEIVQAVAGLLVLGGAFFCFVAALGIVRLQDVLIRMHASSKAGTLGAGMILLAVALYFAEVSVAARAVAAIAFLVVTAPVASHMIGRAAYVYGITLWEGTVLDEMRGRLIPPKAGTPPGATAVPDGAAQAPAAAQAPTGTELARSDTARPGGLPESPLGNSAG
ncbi:monovalent cation/H(+) antiporter subunit G [Rhodocista pekingensis]|uniref:Monovalent cation/H(+) antiporter subunit G n=1 Tax=Rhodocista pekingensis TaxID=201185 RepID=A0ABW2KZC7_9PROT